MRFDPSPHVLWLHGASIPPPTRLWWCDPYFFGGAGGLSASGFSRVHAAAIRSRIGFVHEAPTFYLHLTLATVASIVAPFYPQWDAALFRELASAFELPLGKRVFTLSRGTRTRFALALAMAHHAELLLLDEPSTGLDPVFRRELLDRLSADISDGTASVLFSTHITSDLDRIADYITLLRGGHVVFSTTRDEALETWALVKGGVSLSELPSTTAWPTRGLRSSCEQCANACCGSVAWRPWRLTVNRRWRAFETL